MLCELELDRPRGACPGEPCPFWRRDGSPSTPPTAELAGRGDVTRLLLAVRDPKRRTPQATAPTASRWPTANKTAQHELP